MLRYKLVNSIRDQLGDVDTHLSQDAVNQLTIRQGEVRVVVVGENVAKQKHHPDLCNGGHAGRHDPHPSPHYALGKVLPHNA